MKRFIGLIICMCIYLMTGKDIMAEEKERLIVNITQENGESVLVKSGHTLYTALPVIFTIPDNVGDSYYSISTDNGISFGTYVKMESDSVTLYPDDKTSPEGKWQIRFANVSEGTEKDSEVYVIHFDVTPPVTDIDREGKLTISDDTGIQRCVINIGDTKADETVFDESEQITEYEPELNIKGRAKYGDSIEIICEDIAGNQRVLSFEYLVDESDPQISAEGISDGARLRRGAKLKVKASDGESECYVNYIAERVSGDEVISVSEYNLPADTEIAFDKDGAYSVVLYATDSAGNESIRQRLGFAVDSSAPHIEIGGVCEGVDIKSDARVSIEVGDNLYEDTDVDIILTRTTPWNVQNIPINSYKLNAFRDEREVDINADGEYELHVTATDGVGNTTHKVCRFRIDKTAPDIVVSGINEGEITNEKSALRFRAGEMFYDSTVMSWLLEKREAKGFTPVLNDVHVMRSAQDFFDISVDKEGEYRLTCTAADRSGNTSQKTVAFTVDYTPPVISEISGFDRKFVKSFSLAGKIADYVSDSSPFSAKAYLNDAEFKKGDVVIEEGKYFLTVIAEDAASNVSEETVSFIVDHTAPQIVLSGFDKNGNIKKGSILSVGLLEEGDSLTSVKFNGRSISIDQDNTATIAVNEYGKYDLEIKACDMAGNITDTKIGTECYMYGGLFDGYTVEEKTISASPDRGEDIDIRGLLLGLASVLSGTFGLTYRTYLSGK